VRSTVDPGEHLVYLVNDGHGHFHDGSAAAGLGAIPGGLNLIAGDYDNDGNTDLLVLRGAWLGRGGRIPRALLRNLGDGRFVEVTAQAGLEFPAYPSQAAAFADFDRDGDLDLFVGNEARAGEVYPSQLFRNEGDGTFRDIASVAGVDPFAYTKGAAWGRCRR